MPKDSTVADLDQLHRQARTARSRLEPEWFLCLAYFQNQQWMAWNGNHLFQPQLPKNKIAFVDNRIQAVVRTEIAKMTKNNPTFTVVPRSADEEDSNAAEVGEEIMRYLWKHLDLPELTVKALHWSRICGAGFLKMFWDPTVGDSQEVLAGPDGKVLAGEDGRVVRPGQIPQLPQVAVKRISQGDIRVEARSPFQMFLDPLADSFSECEWAIEESVKSQDYVERRYGKLLEADTPANPGLVEARLGNTFTQGTGGSYKGVKIREYWCKPNSKHPQGYRAVWAKNKMLAEDSKPFDPMPYVMLTGIPVPGRLWPMSVAELLRGPQTELNKVRSQIAENRNRVGNPSLLASRQGTGNPEKFIESTSQPGGVIWFDDVGSPNATPKFLEAPQLPQYVLESIQMTEESIQEISGQHEVTSAQVPPGVTAAAAINLLLESDDTRMGPAMRDYEHKLGAVGQKLLSLVARYYTDSRTIRLGGENGAWQIFDFRGAMLRDNTQVEVQAGSAFPQSKAAKQAAAVDILNYMAQSGQPLQGRKFAQFLKAWELPGADKLIADYTTSETQANRENVMMSQGEQVQLHSYDEDEVHIPTHEDYQRQPHYLQLPQDAQQIIEEHVAEHRKRLSDEQQQQMQMQAQMQNGGQGQGSGQGGPSPEMQELSAAQDVQHQDEQHQGQQAQQQLQIDHASQKQGLDQAKSEQSQRQTEELHQLELLRQQQQLRHADEKHLADGRRADEQHQTRLQTQMAQAEIQRRNAESQRRQQSQQRKPQGANSK